MSSENWYSSTGGTLEAVPRPRDFCPLKKIWSENNIKISIKIEVCLTIGSGRKPGKYGPTFFVNRYPFWEGTAVFHVKREWFPTQDNV